MRRAMLAGARDFLTKPPMGDELISAIRRAGEMAQTERSKSAQSRPFIREHGWNQYLSQPSSSAVSSGKIITVYSPKGGTGCTTIA